MAFAFGSSMMMFSSDTTACIHLLIKSLLNTLCKFISCLLLLHHSILSFMSCLVCPVLSCFLWPAEVSTGHPVSSPLVLNYPHLFPITCAPYCLLWPAPIPCPILATSIYIFLLCLISYFGHYNS